MFPYNDVNNQYKRLLTKLEIWSLVDMSYTGVRKENAFSLPGHSHPMDLLP